MKQTKYSDEEKLKIIAESLGMPSKTFAKYALQDQLNSAGIIGEVEINEVA